MTTFFITGDRSLDPLTALTLTLPVITEHVKDGDSVVTGSLPTGVERAVRYLFLQAGVMQYSSTDDDRPDFEGMFKIVNRTDVDKVLFIHPDPLASRVGAALVATIDPDKLEMVF